MNTSLKLYSVTHKAIQTIPPDRITIGVGEKRSVIGAQITDDVGCNISEKNYCYCELTALYWIWKHETCNFVGLEHYRRFFFSKNFASAHPLTQKKIYKILMSGKIILPKPQQYNETVYAHYAKYHDIHDLEVCISIIRNDFPQYIADCDAVLYSKKLCIANMFIMPKQMLNEYCDWLFHILFKAEKAVDINSKDSYQIRVFGFLSERLFNIWIHHKDPKIYFARVFDATECAWKTRLKSKLKGFFHGKK